METSWDVLNQSGDDFEALPTMATAIGQLCQRWAELEYHARMLLAAVSGMKLNRDTLTILACFDFRDQLTAIKVAALCRPKAKPHADDIIWAIDHIDNSLRNRRNRLVHDRWAEIGTDPTRARRITTNTRGIKPQAHMAPVIVHERKTTEEIGDLMRTVNEVAAYAEFLTELTAAVIRTERGGKKETAPPVTRPPRPFPRPQF